MRFREHWQATTLVSISFLLSTLRDWKVTLEPMAVRKPNQVNDVSFRLASTTPPAQCDRVSLSMAGMEQPRLCLWQPKITSRVVFSNF